MTTILVTGATGQIGSELVPELRRRYGAENVIAARHKTHFSDDITAGGPTTTLDITDYEALTTLLREKRVKKIFHMSSVLSALAEKNRWDAYAVNFQGVFNLLESALASGVSQVIIPSSIAAFGTKSPQMNTPNDSIQNPNTMYGISKLYAEQLGNYYQEKLGLDVRGVRLPGIISWKTEPTAGTTDYAVAIFCDAIRYGHYTCYLSSNTVLPMMYMPDAIKSLVELSEADASQLHHHADFNVHGFSFTPEELAQAIQERMPNFQIDYEIDPMRQGIADSWPHSLDDTAARKEWGWAPSFSIDEMVDDMLVNLQQKLKAS